MNQPVSMSLEINDMVFKSILDNLYSDLPLAIVREICCNAVDSHLVARNYNPFFVQSPTPENPFFIVRDFGTGLSKENVYKYLNTLLSSNKKTETDLTGQYGLGSKAVLAYNDEYKVISYFEGTCYEFLFKRVNKGVPTLELLSEIPTNEPNGIKYIVSVDKSNIENFIYRLSLLKYFRIPPRLFLDLDDPASEITESFQSEFINLHEGFSVHKIKTNYSQIISYNSLFRLGNYNVRLGDVVYDVSNHIGNIFYTRQQDSQYVVLLHNLFPASSFIVDMDPSSLELPLNRESIILNSRNSDLIKSNFITNAVEFLNSLITKFDEKYNTSYEFFSNFAQKSSFFDIVNFSKFLLDNYNCSFSTLINYFGLISSNRMPTELCNFKFHNFCFIHNNNTNNTRLSFSNYSLFYSNYVNDNLTKVILCSTTASLTPTKLDNYSSRNNSEKILGLVSSGEISQTEFESIINVISAIIKTLYPEIIIEYKSEEEVKTILTTESKLRARERRASLGSTTSPNKVSGIRIVNMIRSQYNYRRIYSSTVYNEAAPIVTEYDEQGKPKELSSYFSEDTKILVLSKEDDFNSHSEIFKTNSVYSFDKVLITTEKSFNSVVQTLKNNPEKLIYTLNTLSEYPLIPQEEKDLMKSLYIKDSIYSDLNRIFSLRHDDFSTFQVNLVRFASNIENIDPYLLEVLEELNPSSSLSNYVAQKQRELGYTGANKYSLYRNSLTFNVGTYDKIKSILLPEFLLSNKNEFLNVTTSVDLLKHFIEVAT